MRASNGWIEPRSASIDSAAAMSAARASRSAPASASAATAVDGCVPLISARPSFGPSVDRLEAGGVERVASGHDARIVADRRVAFADQHQRQVRERREVAAGADRPAARHARVHAAVEQREQQLERRAPDAGEALRQDVGAQRHRRAHGADRQRLADAGGVAAQQIQLQRAERVARNRGLGERAEAGVDAVDRLVAGRLAIDDRARRVDARARRPAPARLSAPPSAMAQLFERERRAVEQNHRACTEVHSDAVNAGRILQL